MMFNTFAIICASFVIAAQPASMRVSLPSATAVTAIPGTTIANHGETHLWGTHVVMGTSNNAEARLTFWTDTLPEAKHMLVTADLMQPPTAQQSLMLATKGMTDTLTVRCESVDVSVVRDAQTSSVVRQAHAKDCHLYDMK